MLETTPNINESFSGSGGAWRLLKNKLQVIFQGEVMKNKNCTTFFVLVFAFCLLLGHALPAVHNTSGNLSQKSLTNQGRLPLRGNQRGEELAGKFIPADGMTRLIIGQDLGSIQGYTDPGHFPEPYGVTQYTNIYDLAGLYDITNYGAGDIGLKEAMDRYPNSALSIGLDIVEKIRDLGYDARNGLTEIAQGKHDQNIRELAAFCNHNAPHPIYIRIGYEFDGHWNHYDPVKYIKAYKRIVDIIKPLADNAVFVWQSATYGNTYNNYARMSWYPGDHYVDYIGISFFFYDEQFNGAAYQEMLDLCRSKKIPMFIAESACQGYDLLELTYAWTDHSHFTSKTSQELWELWWELQFLPFIQNNNDVVRLVAYINCDWDSQPMWKWPDAGNGYWGDTRIEVNSFITEKWKNLINNNDPDWNITWKHAGEAVPTPQKIAGEYDCLLKNGSVISDITSAALTQDQWQVSLKIKGEAGVKGTIAENNKKVTFNNGLVLTIESTGRLTSASTVLLKKSTTNWSLAGKWILAGTDSEVTIEQSNTTITFIEAGKTSNGLIAADTIYTTGFNGVYELNIESKNKISGNGISLDRDIVIPDGVYDDTEDYTMTLSATGDTTALFTFNPKGYSPAFVDPHVSINGGATQFLRAYYNNKTGLYELALSNLSQGDSITFKITYEKNGPQYTTGTYIYTHVYQ